MSHPGIFETNSCWKKERHTQYPVPSVDHIPDVTVCSSQEANAFQWRLANGLWALFLAFGTTIAALKVQTARSWRFLNRVVRGILADYGVPIVIISFSCLSFALTGAPKGIPRRLVLPNTWEVTTTWTVAKVSPSQA